ncbi:HlyD family type I secretion periplasmic adaptor subunit [Derxia lacustris]|uniref:HlyD family type I secretion periplasmic adaptor subunit n=1 Tax=Derxia lacustris TaxID=764842 RepID=UPI000A16E4FB|nr:HlyD family type I secretion periplasmic adaptor subunit [Derxia lacustris]
MSLRHRLQAVGVLAGHYARTFGHFWSIRHQTPTGLFREDEAQFLPAALALQETPPSRTVRLLGGVLVALVLTALLWSFLGHLDIVVNAQGKVIPSQRVKTIAAVETGSVVRLDVNEGQTVTAGQVLLQLDTRVHDAERDKARGDGDDAVLVAARNEAFLDALARNRPPALPTRDALNRRHASAIAPDTWQAAARQTELQYQDFLARQRKLADDVAHFGAALPLAEQQAESYRQLLATHDVALVAWQDKEQARLQLQAQLAEARNQLATLVAETRKTAADQLAEARRQTAAATQDARRASASGQLLTLRSPVDGTVQQLAVHTLGSAVQAAAPLMQIVPAGGPVEIEAFIENKDMGFVRAGQPVAVKVETFQYTKYGTVSGRVSQLSEDAIQDEKRGLVYSVKVALDRAVLEVDGRPTPITPGMAVSVEIRTGDRRVIDYVLDPLLRHAHEAANER